MPHDEGDRSRLELVCPCCGARLKIDASLRRVIAHEAPPKQHRAPDLHHASQHLERESLRREASFKQGVEEEKLKSQILERKFEEALKKTQDAPAGPLLRDIDLD